MSPPSAIPPSKEAIVIIIDISHSISSSAISQAKQYATNLIQQKMIFSPTDEVGLVFAGTSANNNNNNSSNDNNNRLQSREVGGTSRTYPGVVVMKPVRRPRAEHLSDIDNAAVSEEGTIDMLEAITVASDLIHDAVKNKKYNRRIILISSVNDAVSDISKERLPVIILELKQRGISLVVLGINFEGLDSDSEESEECTSSSGNNGKGKQTDANWKSISAKQQNERVVTYICRQLNNGSAVSSLRHTIKNLGALRKKPYSERPICMTVMSIGAVKIPVHIYTKTLVQTMPSFEKVSPQGATLTYERRFFCESKEIDAKDRVKALKYGNSFIPCTAEEEEQMKFVSERSIDILSFVDTNEIPIHMLMGGVKAVSPVPGDDEGATALAAFVRGMTDLNRVMLCRYVSRTNADPSLTVCFPSSKCERTLLYMATLPYADDLRRYSFPTFENVTLDTEEHKAIDDVVTAMTLDSRTLRPKDIFNPALQNYYSWLQARFVSVVKLMEEEKKNFDQQKETITLSRLSALNAVGMPLPSRTQALIESSCCWGEKGNVLHKMHVDSIPALQTLREKFPLFKRSDLAYNKRPSWRVEPRFPAFSDDFGSILKKSRPDEIVSRKGESSGCTFGCLEQYFGSGGSSQGATCSDRADTQSNTSTLDSNNIDVSFSGRCSIASSDVPQLVINN